MLSILFKSHSATVHEPYLNYLGQKAAERVTFAMNTTFLFVVSTGFNLGKTSHAHISPGLWEISVSYRTHYGSVDC